MIVGCDVVDVARLQGLVERRGDAVLHRLFTERERADARRGGVRPATATWAARLAARFAAKEATRKALRDLGLPFTSIEVRSEPDGAPSLWVRGEPAPLTCSLSHDGGVAMAVVVGPAAVERSTSDV